jgi:hypothetical protein
VTDRALRAALEDMLEQRARQIDAFRPNIR